ncbi:MlaD family protein [Nocardia kruczakiae]|uniref:MlaD family protein n=1 Tax=Nocardia kruczakiae TaxID=261477 RepID=UPI0007A48415|nr:MlaD family protein [Nocardia kruczakiae]
MNRLRPPRPGRTCRIRWVWRIVPLTLAAALSAGCGLDPGSMPVPGTGVSGDTYHVRIEFANALNLPARAKVMSAGVRVGSLTAVRVTNPGAGTPGMAVADVEIQRSVRLSSATTAQLRQNTLLGDIYIELSTPAGSNGRTVAPDGVIPLAQSKPALQVEDILSGVATFTGSGAVGQFQDIVAQVNAAMPSDPAETSRVAGVLGADLADVAANLDSLSSLGDGIRTDIQAMQDNAAQLTDLLTPESAAQVTAASASVVQLLGVIGGLGGIAHSIEWLAPLAASGDVAAEAFVPLVFGSRPFDLHAPSNLNRLVALLRDKIIPYFEHGPKVNITGIDRADAPALPADQQVGRMLDTLRMIGMVR